MSVHKYSYLLLPESDFLTNLDCPDEIPWMAERKIDKLD